MRGLSVGWWVRLGGLVLVAGLVGCGDDGGSGSMDGSMPDDGGSMADGGYGDDAGPMADGGGTRRTLSLELTNVPSLGADFVYEGWLIVDGSPVSTGRFTVDAEGRAQPGSFEVDAAQADAATLFVLTIEPASGDDPAPAATHLLAGAFDAGTATLTVDHTAALGTDFSSAAGSYVLNTPSTADDDTDANQGIWWLTPGEPPSASLSLPTLPDGWVYEGWVVGDDGPVSTGRFTNPAEADSDGAGPTAGPDAAPPFPGQDFVMPARVLVGQAAVISVEPEPDDSPMPFAIKPLVDTDIEDVAAPMTQPMAVSPASQLPGGVARLR